MFARSNSFLVRSSIHLSVDKYYLYLMHLVTLLHSVSQIHSFSVSPSNMSSVRSDVACLSAAFSIPPDLLAGITLSPASAPDTLTALAPYHHVTITAKGKLPTAREKPDDKVKSHSRPAAQLSHAPAESRPTSRPPSSLFHPFATAHPELQTNTNDNGFLQGPRQARQGDPSPRPYRYDFTAPRTDRETFWMRDEGD